MNRTPDDWYKALVACGVTAHIAQEWAIVFSDVVTDTSFSQGEAELDDFLGQILHESGLLTTFTENLNYSAERLCVVWPGRFPTLADARPYAHNPEALANRVYGGRLGNTDPGDGWRYRGRSPIQLTGKDNYARVGELMGQDLVTMPELLEQPRFALEACIHWWEDRIPDSMIGDVTKISTRVNGALLGLADRERLTQDATEALA